MRTSSTSSLGGIAHVIDRDRRELGFAAQNWLRDGAGKLSDRGDVAGPFETLQSAAKFAATLPAA